MIYPSCDHEVTTPQEGREAVITHEEALRAFDLIREGRACDAELMIRGFLERPSTNDERATNG